MIYLVGEMSNGSKKLEDTYPRGIGRCYVERPIRPFVAEPWFLDNGVFRAYNANGRNPDTDYSRCYAFFEGKLEEASTVTYERGEAPLFIVAPDRPGDPSSLDVSIAWLDEYEYGGRMVELDPVGAFANAPLLPVYIAVQNGMSREDLESVVCYETDRPLLSRISGIFLGGTDDFKEETAAMWRELATEWGLSFHYGRCTQSLIAKAVELGCDSADSAHPVRLAGARWERFLEVADAELGTTEPEPTPSTCDGVTLEGERDDGNPDPEHVQPASEPREDGRGRGVLGWSARQRSEAETLRRAGAQGRVRQRLPLRSASPQEEPAAAAEPVPGALPRGVVSPSRRDRIDLLVNPHGERDEECKHRDDRSVSGRLDRESVRFHFGGASRDNAERRGERRHHQSERADPSLGGVRFLDSRGRGERAMTARTMGRCFRCKLRFSWTGKKGRRLRDAWCPECGTKLSQTVGGAKNATADDREPYFGTHGGAQGAAAQSQSFKAEAEKEEPKKIELPAPPRAWPRWTSKKWYPCRAGYECEDLGRGISAVVREIGGDGARLIQHRAVLTLPSGRTVACLPSHSPLGAMKEAESMAGGIDLEELEDPMSRCGCGEPADGENGNCRHCSDELGWIMEGKRMRGAIPPDLAATYLDLEAGRPLD